MFNVLYIHLASLPYVDLGPGFWKNKFSRFVNIDVIIVHNALDHFTNLVHISRITNLEIWQNIPKIVMSVDNTQIIDRPESWHFFSDNMDLFSNPQENCGHIKLDMDLHLINDFSETKSHAHWKDEFSRIHSHRQVNYLIMKPTSIINLFSDINEIHEEVIHWPYGQKSFGVILNWKNRDLSIVERFYVSEKNITKNISTVSNLEELLSSIEKIAKEDITRIQINLDNYNEIEDDFSRKLEELLSVFSDAKQPVMLDWIGNRGEV